jgi:hypothetical protein
MRKRGRNVISDPYLAWSVATGFAGHSAVVDGAERIPLLVRRRSGEELAGVWMAPVYRSAQFEHAVVWARHAKQDLEAVQASVAALELALPLSGAAEPVADAPHPAGKSNLVIGVIDHGCAFLNKQFRHASDRSKTRIVAVWDQATAASSTARPSTLPPDAQWTPVADFGYGRELSGSAIDRLIGGLRAPSDEERTYRELDYLLEEPRPGARRVLLDESHGTHVLDLAGGLARHPHPAPLAGDHAGSHPIDASEAELLFVDVPRGGLRDTTGASSSAFLIDALHYIHSRAAAGARIVVNISLGALAGPHDGTSLIERAMDEFLRTHENVVITVAAGNSAEESWHASGNLAPGQRASLEWTLIPGDPTDNFLELWFSDAPKSPPSKVRVRLLPSAGAAPASCEIGAAQDVDIGAPPLAQLIARSAEPPHRDKATGGKTNATGAKRQAMVLLAVAPTAPLTAAANGTSGRMPKAARPVAPAGRWQIEVHNESEHTAVRFDAWVQRDEPGIGERRDPIQSFLSRSACAAAINGEGALNSLATGGETIAVGATDEESGKLTAYTPRGVTRADRRDVRDIDVAAPADASPVTIGILAAGVISGSLVRMGGTSVAAPLVARELANRIARGSGPFAGGFHAADVKRWLEDGAPSSGHGKPGDDGPSHRPSRAGHRPTKSTLPVLDPETGQFALVPRAFLSRPAVYCARV